MYKQNKGVTLIILVITILLILIIASTVIYNISYNQENERLREIRTDITKLQGKINIYYAQNGTLPILEEYVPQEMPDRNENDDNNYFVINLRLLQDLTLAQGKGYEDIIRGREATQNVTDVYIINQKTHTIYYAEGVTANGQTYHTVESTYSVIELSNIENKPQLLEGMTPVKYVFTGELEGRWEETTSNDMEWYNYSEKKWANAITEDESFWVWIPRFEYAIDNDAQTTTVKFIKQTQTIADEGFIIHPAFTKENSSNFENGGWNEDLAGIWVAKFEAGYAMDKNGDQVSDITGGNSVNPVSSSVYYSQTQVTSTATESGQADNTVLTARNWLDGIYGTTETKIKYPVFQGKTISMNYISANDAYNICRALTESGNIYGLNNNTTDSHLIKNSEWGAVVYLSKSQYGLGSTNIYINNVSLNTGSSSSSNTFSSAYALTGYSASSANAQENIVVTSSEFTNNLNSSKSWVTVDGAKASSTGNITGIYDMSGGLIEMTSGYISNSQSSSSTNASAFSKMNISTKYATKYPYNLTNDTSSANYTENTEIYGDAIREVSTAGTGATSWGEDTSIYAQIANFIFARGGSYLQGAMAGISAFQADDGAPAYNKGFRAVLIGI